MSDMQNPDITMKSICLLYVLHLWQLGSVTLSVQGSFFFLSFVFISRKKKKSLLYLNKIPFNQFSQKYKIKVKLKSKHISKTKELVIQNLLQLQTCSTVNNRYLEKKSCIYSIHDVLILPMEKQCNLISAWQCRCMLAGETAMHTQTHPGVKMYPIARSFFHVVYLMTYTVKLFHFQHVMKYTGNLVEIKACKMHEKDQPTKWM